MPTDEYNAGFAKGEADRHEGKTTDTSGKSQDYKEGYEHGKTGTS